MFRLTFATALALTVSAPALFAQDVPKLVLQIAAQLVNVDAASPHHGQRIVVLG